MSWTPVQNEILICNDKTIDQFKLYAELLTLFLKETSFFTESYILDYFVKELWTKLPVGWLEVVSNLEVHDLEAFLNPENSIRYREPWPLSLLAFRSSAFALTALRKSIKSPEVIKKFLNENFFEDEEGRNNTITSEKTKLSFSTNEFEEKSGQHKNIPEFCRRHVKPKKQHEIFRMAQLSDIVFKHFGLKFAIDMGSGQGHLSRLLALCYNVKMATIEANQGHVSGAFQFDQQALTALEHSKKKADTSQNSVISNSTSLPHHVEGSITVASSDSYLEKVLKDTWNETFDENKESFALMGLHACGNLTETILKTFVKQKHCEVLLSIGCCYMKLESNSDGDGYPLSCFVKSLPHHALSYEAKELACHAIEMYIQRIHVNAPALKIHCYRATLEKCIIHHDPSLKHLGLRGVKHAETMEFHEYAERALSRATISIPKEYLLSEEVKSCVERWKEVLVFYSLRLIVAPVVESLILVDRLIYLYEQGKNFF
ncbi:hypothetical protein JTE90_028173 [Oedothorax gibbosus]|uniref:Methyltransferase domain-containing protein n=1 Tax=Oedothorax gibbosus TaxID=931172 RepID=A0AAV6VBP0_9ARAC|nr:hypothetical protein JTE90_028173 [Oedothorax gibbosus]